jgi:hypothetical protein
VNCSVFGSKGSSSQSWSADYLKAFIAIFDAGDTQLLRGGFRDFFLVKDLSFFSDEFDPQLLGVGRGGRDRPLIIE